MEAANRIQVRAVKRQHRIMQRAVRRGEKPESELAAFVAANAAILGADPEIPPDDSGESGTPFVDRQMRPVHLRDLYAGSAVFILLGGPSAAKLDLSLLRRRGAIVFGVNNSPVMLRPQLWTFVDKPLKFHDAIWRDPAVMKFVPHRLFGRPIREKADGAFRTIHRESEGGVSPVRCQDMPGVVGYARNADFRVDRWLSEATINWGNSLKSSQANRNHRSLNTMFAVLKISYWLGFRVAYLLGCDFRMEAESPYAFAQGGDAGKASANNVGYAVMSEMFAQLKPRFDEAGFRVFNCNPASGLTVFPHVSYSEAIKSATGHVPQEPLDAAGWYDA